MDYDTFKNSAVDIIKKRNSVRSYSDEVISDAIKDKINECISSLKGPFSKEVILKLIDKTDITEKMGGKMGTYGVIKGNPSYIISIAENTKEALVQLGFVFEELILYCTFLGLGTCWLGGTFKRKDLLNIISKNSNDIVPAISPLGYSANRNSFMDYAIRKLASSDKRKDWNQLFFNDSFNRSIEHQEENLYHRALEMVRLAPSASNKQPWRIVAEEEVFHFYMEKSLNYGKALGFNIHYIDMGIAMCHFDLALAQEGIKGKWEMNNLKVSPLGTMEYIASWHREF